MSTPADAYFVRYQFTLIKVNTPEDIAEMGLWFRALGGAEYGDPELASIAEGAYNAWNAHMNPGLWATNVELSSVVASNYLANGHTLHEQNFVPETPWVGSDSAAAMPWETSLAVSLYTYPRGTFVTDGRRKRGRCYLPPMAASQLDPSNSGFFKNSNFAGLLTAVSAWLNDADQDRLGVQVGRLAVFSRADSETRDVVQISMDAKFDSQRRRQNREIAGHVEVAYP